MGTFGEDLKKYIMEKEAKRPKTPIIPPLQQTPEAKAGSELAEPQGYLAALLSRIPNALKQTVGQFGVASMGPVVKGHYQNQGQDISLQPPPGYLGGEELERSLGGNPEQRGPLLDLLRGVGEAAGYAPALGAQALGRGMLGPVIAGKEAAYLGHEMGASPETQAKLELAGNLGTGALQFGNAAAKAAKAGVGQKLSATEQAAQASRSSLAPLTEEAIMAQEQAAQRATQAEQQLGEAYGKAATIPATAESLVGDIRQDLASRIEAIDLAAHSPADRAAVSAIKEAQRDLGKGFESLAEKKISEIRDRHGITPKAGAPVAEKMATAEGIQESVMAARNAAEAPLSQRWNAWESYINSPKSKLYSPAAEEAVVMVPGREVGHAIDEIGRLRAHIMPNIPRDPKLAFADQSMYNLERLLQARSLQGADALIPVSEMRNIMSNLWSATQYLPKGDRRNVLKYVRSIVGDMESNMAKTDERAYKQYLSLKKDWREFKDRFDNNKTVSEFYNPRKTAEDALRGVKDKTSATALENAITREGLKDIGRSRLAKAMEGNDATRILEKMRDDPVLRVALGPQYNAVLKDLKALGTFSPTKGALEAGRISTSDLTKAATRIRGVLRKEGLSPTVRENLQDLSNSLEQRIRGSKSPEARAALSGMREAEIGAEASAKEAAEAAKHAEDWQDLLKLKLDVSDVDKAKKLADAAKKAGPKALSNVSDAVVAELLEEPMRHLEAGNLPKFQESLERVRPLLEPFQGHISNSDIRLLSEAIPRLETLLSAPQGKLAQALNKLLSSKHILSKTAIGLTLPFSGTLKSVALVLGYGARHLANKSVVRQLHRAILNEDAPKITQILKRALDTKAPIVPLMRQKEDKNAPTRNSQRENTLSESPKPIRKIGGTGFGDELLKRMMEKR